MLKKFICCILAGILLFSLFSCSDPLSYEMEYPAVYTGLYCFNNYVEADPGFIPIIAAENEIGRFNNSPYYRRYYGIKHTPLEKYLFVNTNFFALLGGDSQYSIFRHKDNTVVSEMSEGKAIRAEFYWVPEEAYFIKDDVRWFATKGQTQYAAGCANLNEKFVQSCISEQLLNEELERWLDPFLSKEKAVYVKRQDEEGEAFYLHLRIFFAGADGIVWDTPIAYHKEREMYYLRGYVPKYNNNGEFNYFTDRTVYLPEEMVWEIPAEVQEAITGKDASLMPIGTEEREHIATTLEPPTQSPEPPADPPM